MEGWVEGPGFGTFGFVARHDGNAVWVFLLLFDVFV